MTSSYSFGSASQVGFGKSACQDACLCAEVDLGESMGAIALACDGVGGLEDGELASSTVVVRFAEWVESMRSFQGDCTLDYVEAEWRRLVDQANKAIVDYGSACNKKLGTTLSAILILKDQALICQIGDSRVYELSPEGARALTRDHTLVGKMVEAGELTKLEAEQHPQRHVITEAIGAKDQVNFDFYRINAKEGFLYLACSDGFYSRMDMGYAYEQLVAAGFNMDGACSSLVEYAKAAGEQDDITVAAIGCSRTASAAAFEEDPRKTLFVGAWG